MEILLFFTILGLGIFIGYRVSLMILRQMIRDGKAFIRDESTGKWIPYEPVKRWTSNNKEN